MRRQILKISKSAKEKKKKRLADSIANAQRENETLNKEKGDIILGIKEKKIENEKVVNQLAENTVKLDKINEDIKNSDTTNTTLTKSVENLQEQEKNISTIVKEKTDIEMGKVEGNIQAKKQDITALKETKQGLEQKNQTLEGKNNEIGEDIGTKEGELSGINKAIAENKTKEVKSKNKLGLIERQLALIEQSLNSNADTKEQRQLLIATLKEQIQGLKNEISDSVGELAGIKEKIEEANKKLEEVKDQKLTMLTEIKEVKEAKEMLKEAYKKVGKQYSFKS